MRLRQLRMEDAPLMLEWMHDYDVVSKLKTDFMSKTLSKISWTKSKNQAHKATRK